MDSDARDAIRDAIDIVKTRRLVRRLHQRPVPAVTFADEVADELAVRGYTLVADDDVAARQTTRRLAQRPTDDRSER